MARKTVEIIEKEIEVEEARYIIHLMSNKMAEVTIEDTYYLYKGTDPIIYYGSERIFDSRVLECHGEEYVYTDKIVKVVKVDSKKVKKTIKIKKTTYKQLFGKDKTFYSEVKNA